MRWTLTLVSLIWLGPHPAVTAAEPFEWQTATPESQGMSSGKLEALKDGVAATTQALLVVRNDRIVYEWYAGDRSASDRHYTASLAKALVGGMSLAVAITDGKIQLDDPVSRYIPQWKDAGRKSRIMIRHLGSHTSGLDDSRPNEEAQWKDDFWSRFDPPNDPFSIARDKTPVLFDPGEKLHYSNPGIALLTYAVTAAIREGPIADVRTLLRDRIMRPIGVPDAEWSIGYGQTFNVEGLPLVGSWGGGGYTPRAVARVGRLVLREGDWDGQRLLSAEAVRQITADAGLPGNCGMGWWTNAAGRYSKLPKDAVYGAGAGDQVLLVVPSLQLIMVRNGQRLAPEPQEGDQFARFHDPRARMLFEPLIEAITEAADASDMEERRSESGSTAAPYPPSPAIAGIRLDWSTHRRDAQGSDNFQLTWADDGHQYGWWGDGGGFGGTNSDGRVGLGFARIEGDWDDWQGFNVWGGKDAEHPARFDGKSWGTISVGGVLYSWIVPDVPESRSRLPGGTQGRSDVVPQTQPARQAGPTSAEERPARDHYRYIELARSTDRGATWTKAGWRWRIEDNLIVPTFLNFGKDNAGARDEYVYSYFIRPQRTDVTQSSFGLNVHHPGAVFLARVPSDRLFEGRERYEWFRGFSGGQPAWGSLEDKQPVFEDPNGTGWCLSASYNAGLGRYLLATEHTRSHVDGLLGIFDAPEPWGPWTTVKYWTPRDRFGERRPGSDLEWRHNVFFLAFSPKWLSADGRSFTLLFTGGGRGRDNDSFNTVRGRFVLRESE